MAGVLLAFVAAAFSLGALALAAGFRLDRPVFGDTTAVALTGWYRLSTRGRVTLTVLRGRTVVKRFRTAERARGRTVRFSLPATGLRRGRYTVRLLVQSGEDQVLSVLTARRL